MKNIIILLFLFFVGAAVSLPALAAPSLAFDVDSAEETIELKGEDLAPAKVFLLSNPSRLVVDLPSAAEKPSPSLPASYKGKLLKQLRVGQFNENTIRLVFELREPVKIIENQGNDGRLRVVIAPAAAAGAKKETRAGEREKSKKQPAKPAKSVIVIDAGHGGIDPGAIGPRGTREKDVVLAIAKQLADKINKTGKYRALLTREGDYFIMLRKRFEIARKHKAAIFISLHADSAPNDEARGLSVYTLSEQASDKEAEALAARENKSDIIGGMDLSTEREDVADILISLAQRETKNRSATLADMLVQSLDEEVKLLPNSHRFAGFAVLKAPDVPSVLIETGFLSNAKDEKLLNSREYRDKITRGIVAGIDDYFEYWQRVESE